MWKKKGSSKWALLKHVTRTNSIGTCSSELYIFSLLKLPPPPRAAILVYRIYLIHKYKYTGSKNTYACVRGTYAKTLLSHIYIYIYMSEAYIMFNK